MPTASLSVPRGLGVVLLGVVVGTVGTGVHRASVPWGVVLALASAVAAGILVRAWTGRAGVLVHAAVVTAVVFLFTAVRPGDDVIIADQTVGYVWFGALPAALLALVLPRRWFSDDPLPGGPERGGAAP